MRVTAYALLPIFQHTTKTLLVYYGANVNAMKMYRYFEFF